MDKITNLNKTVHVTKTSNKNDYFKKLCNNELSLVELAQVDLTELSNKVQKQINNHTHPSIYSLLLKEAERVAPKKSGKVNNNSCL